MSTLLDLLLWPVRAFHSAVVALTLAVGMDGSVGYMYFVLFVLASVAVEKLHTLGAFTALRAVITWWSPNAWRERAHAQQLARLEQQTQLLRKQQELTTLRSTSRVAPDESELAFHTEMQRLDRELVLLAKRQEVAKLQPPSPKRTKELSDLDHQLAVLAKRREQAAIEGDLNKLKPKAPPPPVDHAADERQKLAKADEKAARLREVDKWESEQLAGKDPDSEEGKRIHVIASRRREEIMRQ